MDDNTPRNLSRHQYRTLRYIKNHQVTMAALRRAHGNTLGSLAQNDYIRRIGAGDGAEVVLTQRGLTALDSYNESGMNERKHAADVTERCLRLLRHVRNIAAA